MMNQENQTQMEQANEKPTEALNFNIFSEKLRKTIKTKGWDKPMLVQAKVAPLMLEGKDTIVQSRTGSGKTAAFLLPIIEKLQGCQTGCKALILTPTRELASQVYKEFAELSEGLDLMGTPIYGGTSYRPQLDALKAGTNIVIGTPGRILDHLIRGTLRLDNLNFLVFDEADELLSMGFFKDMVKIGDFISKKPVTTMFSATMPDSVRRLAETFMKKPEFLGLSKDGVHVSEMDHLFYVVDAMSKDRMMMRIIEMEDPDSAIIFCNTKSEVEYLAALMKRFGYNADQLSGDLNQRTRDSVMTKLRSGELRFLVATDIAARGIDISNLEYVIIYDMHKDFSQYVHRAGRTARAGKRGVAMSLVTSLEAVDLKRFAKRNEIELIEKTLPTEENVQTRLSEKILARLEAELRDASSARKERILRYDKLLEEIENHENGKDFMKMLLDGFHQALIRMGRGTPSPVKKEAPIIPSSSRRPFHGPKRSSNRGPRK